MRKLARFGWLMVLVISFAATFTMTPAQAITGGTNVGISLYPYIARVTYSLNFRTYSCGGALIDNRWIITAAHCVVDPATGNKISPSKFKVAVGVDQPFWGQNWIRVNRVERHPNFPAHLGDQRTWPADVGLIQIESAVSRTPVALASREPAPGTDVTYVGWGCTTASLADCGGAAPRALQARPSTVQTDQTCRYSGAYVSFNFCTTRGGASTTRHGDSGGPALMSAPGGVRLAGVVSGSNAHYDTTSSVPYVLGWIHQVTGIGAPADPAPPPPPPSPTSNGSRTYAYSVYHTCANGACGLNIRSGPGYSNYAVIGRLYDGNAVQIVCQTRGQAVYGADGSYSTVWDKLASGGYVADFYINTPGMNGAFSPPIPQC